MNRKTIGYIITVGLVIAITTYVWIQFFLGLYILHPLNFIILPISALVITAFYLLKDFKRIQIGATT